MNQIKLIQDKNGLTSSNRLVFISTYVVILGLMIYVTIIGDPNRAAIVERFSLILLPVTIAKVTQTFSPQEK
ncbi:MAG: hypothetical protein AB4372_27850 [Xenococcus sp. (in: cyanobacteria)]